jgi:hypothetical protein
VASSALSNLATVLVIDAGVSIFPELNALTLLMPKVALIRNKTNNSNFLNFFVRITHYPF